MKPLVRVLVVIVLGCGTVAAQGVPPAPPAAPESVPEPSQNVRIDVAVLETGGAHAQSRKVTSMTLRSGRAGGVRSSDAKAENKNVGLRFDVDARPVIQRDGKISTSFSLIYQSATSGSRTQQNMEPVLESGKKLVVSEAADPASDRRVTVEVTATILK